MIPVQPDCPSDAMASMASSGFPGAPIFYVTTTSSRAPHDVRPVREHLAHPDGRHRGTFRGGSSKAPPAAKRSSSSKTERNPIGVHTGATGEVPVSDHKSLSLRTPLTVPELSEARMFEYFSCIISRSLCRSTYCAGAGFSRCK